MLRKHSQWAVLCTAGLLLLAAGLVVAQAPGGYVPLDDMNAHEKLSLLAIYGDPTFAPSGLASEIAPLLDSMDIRIGPSHRVGVDRLIRQLSVHERAAILVIAEDRLWYDSPASDALSFYASLIRADMR